MTERKKCNTCQESLPVDRFAFKNLQKGIRHPRCRTCKAAYNVSLRTATAESLEADRARTKARVVALKAERVAKLKVLRLSGSCVGCQCQSSEKKPLMFLGRRDYAGKVLNVTLNLGEATFQAALAGSELRCGECRQKEIRKRSKRPVELIFHG